MTRIDQLRHDVAVLAESIGERHVWLPGKLRDAEHFLSDTLSTLGFPVERQTFQAEQQTVANLIAEKPGSTHPENILVFAAHYDSRCGMDKPRHGRRIPGLAGTPGANDNASGIATLLSLARHFTQRTHPWTLRFVALVNEEPPFFQTPLMGSWVYAQECKRRGDRLRGAMIFDTIGYYTDAPKSQRYFFPFNLLYPSVGNFVAMLSNLKSRRWLRESAQAFRGSSDFPLVSTAVPLWSSKVGWSDDWSFWQAGYPALCVTDTAFLRYPHYHMPEDTPEKLDYYRLTQVVTGLCQAVERMGRVI